MLVTDFSITMKHHDCQKIIADQQWSFSSFMDSCICSRQIFFKNHFHIKKMKIHVNQDDICHLFGRHQEQLSILYVYELQCIYTNNNMKVILQVLLWFSWIWKVRSISSHSYRYQNNIDQLQKAATVTTPGCCIPTITIMLILCKHHWTMDECFTLSTLSSSLLDKYVKYMKCIISVLEITTDLQLWDEKETIGVVYNHWENWSQLYDLSPNHSFKLTV